MLISMAPLLKDAREKGYGIAAPGIYDLQTAAAALSAAAELKSPIILDVYQNNDLEAIGDIVRFLSSRFESVPFALNLDHGESFEVTVRAIRAGFSSVMIDCSTKPFAENVALTSEVVKMAHAVGVSVEAELGHVGSGARYEEDRDKGLTDPAEAVEFVRQTGVDCLAVAVGTAHGKYAGTPRIDFERLAKLREVVPAPLVLHGGSSTGDENLSKAVRQGITKVNLFTDLVFAGALGIKTALSSGKDLPLPALYAAGVAGYKDMLKHYIELFGSAGKA